ncbi:MAG: AAA family ATPase, partial [Proteobacteria bacterium]|nr:AAA family ATPase [Pseudomonadota bacterium]
VEVQSLTENECILKSEDKLSIREGSTVELILYPWFLYEKLIEGIGNLKPDDCGIPLALSVFGKGESQTGRDDSVLSDSDNQLNSSQLEAIRCSLASGVSYIWGPPGTGKTHTLGLLIRECMRIGYRTLVVSTTNSAVDSIIEMIDKLDLIKNCDTGKRTIKIGRPHEAINAVNLSSVMDDINNDTYISLTALRRRKSEIKKLKETVSNYRLLLEETEIQFDLFDELSVTDDNETKYIRLLDSHLPSSWKDYS